MHDINFVAPNKLITAIYHIDLIINNLFYGDENLEIRASNGDMTTITDQQIKSIAQEIRWIHGSDSNILAVHHDATVARLRAEGWRQGTRYDPVQKTDPSVVDYDDSENEYKIRVMIVTAVVRGFLGVSGDTYWPLSDQPSDTNAIVMDMIISCIASMTPYGSLPVIRKRFGSLIDDHRFWELLHSVQHRADALTNPSE